MLIYIENVTQIKMSVIMDIQNNLSSGNTFSNIEESIEVHLIL